MFSLSLKTSYDLINYTKNNKKTNTAFLTKLKIENFFSLLFLIYFVTKMHLQNNFYLCEISITI